MKKIFLFMLLASMVSSLMSCSSDEFEDGDSEAMIGDPVYFQIHLALMDSDGNYLFDAKDPENMIYKSEIYTVYNGKTAEALRFEPEAKPDEPGTMFGQGGTPKHAEIYFGEPVIALKWFEMATRKSDNIDVVVDGHVYNIAFEKGNAPLYSFKDLKYYVNGVETQAEESREGVIVLRLNYDY